ncbi:TPA: hypothetical protein ACKROR_003206, partial [Pseudomonas aeruginosa]
MDRSKLPALILHSPRRPTFPARPSSRVERCHEISVGGQLLYSIVVRFEFVVVICLVGYQYDCRKAIISLIEFAF